MNMFSKILSKLGIKKSTPDEETRKEAVPEKPAAKTPVKRSPIRREHSKHPVKRHTRKLAPKGSVAPVAMEMVDVMGKLETMGKGSGLNWKQSIVDLLKVLDMDSNLAAREELAKELACPADLMGDSAKMNTWLHKTVLQKIAKNGGNVPQDLLD